MSLTNGQQPYADLYRRIGHITPSSNTVLEPITARMTVSLSDRLSHHFTRIPVTRINLDRQALAQFDSTPMVKAAALLADAPLDGILWNGTSGGWRGVAADRKLKLAVEDTTGLPFSTSILAQLDVFRDWNIRKYALAVPYLNEVAEKIEATFAAEGVKSVGRSALGISTNRTFAQVAHEDIRDLVREADAPDAECVVIVCTNFPAAPVVEDLEAELGKPIFDSVAVTFWKALQMAQLGDVKIQGWGRLLRHEHR